MDKQIVELKEIIENVKRDVMMLEKKVDGKVSKTEILSDLDQALKLTSGRK
ncbi:hypothetical protein ACIQUE_27265 [Bacillus cereus]|uniref:hypothetical protein n=1 Tax=Bacillus cereus TaxID=1396 RepID=UPI0038004132